MEGDLYDEFGNYIGPELEESDDSEEEREEEEEDVENLQEVHNYYIIIYL